MHLIACLDKDLYWHLFPFCHCFWVILTTDYICECNEN